jgi:hypothetical protein
MTLNRHNENGENVDAKQTFEMTDLKKYFHNDVQIQKTRSLLGIILILITIKKGQNDIPNQTFISHQRFKRKNI